MLRRRSLATALASLAATAAWPLSVQAQAAATRQAIGDVPDPDAMDHLD